MAAGDEEEEEGPQRAQESQFLLHLLLPCDAVQHAIIMLVPAIVLPKLVSITVTPFEITLVL
jgi:hypothetical protein